jgi:chromosome segregation ATPase
MNTFKSEFKLIETKAHRTATEASKCMKRKKEDEHILFELSNEVAALKKKVANHITTITLLEEERDHNVNEALELEKRVKLLFNEFSDAQEFIHIIKREKMILETDLKQKMILHATLQNDHFLLNQNCTEIQDFVTDLQNNLKVLRHQFDQIKEEIINKKELVAKYLSEKEEIKKENHNLLLEIAKYKTAIRDEKSENLKEDKKFRMLNESYIRLRNENKESASCLEKTIPGRELLDRKLNEKNMESEFLKKKVKIQEKILSRGESKYQERIEDTRILKLENKRLEAEIELSQKDNLTMNEGNSAA